MAQHRTVAEARGVRALTVFLNGGWLSLIAITVLGAALRGWQLTAHPLWSDEFATLVFSLGHGFVGVPLDQVVTGDRLLESLTVQGDLGPGATLDRLLTESNHPPLYFLISNLWIHLWQSPGQWVDVGVARSLSAAFGVLAIPGTYGLVKLGTGQGLGQSSIHLPEPQAERDALALIAAFLMAVSPFGIYLSQETRHYTLALGWAIASLGCWLRFVRHWSQPQSSLSPSRLPPWLPWLWIIVNGLGLATHFFMGLLLLAEAITLGVLTLWFGVPRSRDRWTLAIAGLGTAITAGVWIPYAQSIPKAGLTDWLAETVTWITGIEAIARLIALNNEDHDHGSPAAGGKSICRYPAHLRLFHGYGHRVDDRGDGFRVEIATAVVRDSHPTGSNRGWAGRDCTFRGDGCHCARPGEGHHRGRSLSICDVASNGHADGSGVVGIMAAMAPHCDRLAFDGGDQRRLCGPWLSFPATGPAGFNGWFY